MLPPTQAFLVELVFRPFPGSDEKRAPLKTPALEARERVVGLEIGVGRFWSNMVHLVTIMETYTLCQCFSSIVPVLV